MNQYPLFLILALVAEILGTVSGFGSSIIFVPIASLFFDFKTVLGITAIFHVFSNISKITLFRSGVQKDIVIKLGIPAIVFVIIGAIFTAYFSLKNMELIMNSVIIFSVIYLFFSIKNPVKQSTKNLYLGGAASGFFAGISGTGGAIRGIVLSAFQLPKNTFIATSAVIDLGVDFSRAIIYIISGYFNAKFIALIPFLIGISYLGSYLGKLILYYTSEKVFRYIVLFAIVGTALSQLIKYLFYS